MITIKNKLEIEKEKFFQKQKTIIDCEFRKGEILVIEACPGGGKTYIIVKRIKEIIKNCDNNFKEVLVLTSSNNGVNVIKKMIFKEIGMEKSIKMKIKTIHSFSTMIFKMQKENQEVKSQKKILNDIDMKNLMNNFIKKNNLILENNNKKGHKNEKKCKEVLENVKNNNNLDYVSEKLEIEKKTLELFFEYLNKNNIISHHDCIKEAIEILDKPEYWSKNLKNHMNSIKYIFIDDFHETDFYSRELIKVVLKQANKNEPKHITLTFNNQYKFLNKEFLMNKKQNEIDNFFSQQQIKKFTINRSYRLTPNFTKAIQLGFFGVDGIPNYNENFFDSLKEDLHSPIVFEGETNFEQFLFIANEILRLLLKLGGLLRPSDFAILGFSNKDVDNIFLFFSKLGFKCSRLSSNSPLYKSNTLMLMNILKIMNNSSGSHESLISLILVFDKKKDKLKRINQILDLFKKISCDTTTNKKENLLHEFISTNLKNIDTITQTCLNNKSLEFISIYNFKYHNDTLNSIKNFLSNIEIEKKKLINNFHPQTIMESLLYIIKNSFLIENLNCFEKLKDFDDNKVKLELNISLFYKSLNYFYNKYLTLTFTNYISFIDYFIKNHNENNSFDNHDKFKISTISLIKGSEFPVVFLPSNNNNFCKNSFWLTENNNKSVFLDKKRNELFYTAFTRSSSLTYIGVDCLKKLNHYSFFKNFTFKTPLKNENLIEDVEFVKKLSASLDREVPTKKKIVEGCDIYKKLNCKNFKNAIKINQIRSLCHFFYL